MSLSYKFKLGYDYFQYKKYGIKIPLYVPIGHVIIVGGSGSGKSSTLIYYLYNIRKAVPVEFTILDFKKSGELEGITEPENYAEFEDCPDLIARFYEKFQSIPEGGDGRCHILVIDEIAGLLSHLSLSKEGKAQADTIRQIMSSLLMLGRSRNVFLWLVMQRYSANIFPASSGAVDNFSTYIGLGKLSVDSRRSLFAGEHSPEEDELFFGQGTGIVVSDGNPLFTLLLPKLDKKQLLLKLQSE